ncbi:DMT family transporter [Nonomuraea dietziae]|uniref:DMT family transporter n=1 Tax=Nonomuraea dietziae TaxID=65515 RepID=UPI0033DCBA55
MSSGRVATARAATARRPRAARPPPWPRPEASSAIAAVASTLYLGLLPSALGFVTWGYAVARYTIAQSTAALYLVPPLAIGVAFVWLGEIPGPVELAGGLISMAGVILIHRHTARSAVVPEPSSPLLGEAEK